MKGEDEFRISFKLFPIVAFANAFPFDCLSCGYQVALNNFQPGPSGQFSTTNGGQWQITIEACVIDGDSINWTTGPKS